MRGPAPTGGSNRVCLRPLLVPVAAAVLAVCPLHPNLRCRLLQSPVLSLMRIPVTALRAHPTPRMISRSLTTHICKHPVSSEVTSSFWEPGHGHVFWGVYSAATGHEQTPRALGFTGKGVQQQEVLPKRQRWGGGGSQQRASPTAAVAHERSVVPPRSGPHPGPGSSKEQRLGKAPL